MKRIFYFVALLFLLLTGCQQATRSQTSSQRNPASSTPATEFADARFNSAASQQEISAAQTEIAALPHFQTPTPTVFVPPTQIPIPTETPIPATSTTVPLTDTAPPPLNTSEPATATTVPISTATSDTSFTPMPPGIVARISTQALNIRNGPGDEFDVVGHVEEGAVLPVLGADSEGDWVLVIYEPGHNGWLAMNFVALENGGIPDLPIMEPTSLPLYVKLDGMTYMRQAFNNCAPTALTIALTYYGGPTDPMIAANYLRPDFQNDVSVDIAQMADYVNLNFPGLKAVWRMGGNWTTIRSLVAAGFPVVIETSIEVTGRGAGWAGHNRVIVGYDGDVILTYDSYLGSGNLEGYRVYENRLDELWQHMNRNFLVIYPAEREQEVTYLMGEDWEIESNIAKAHRMALAEMAANPNNAYALYNLADTYVALGQYEEAAELYDQAFDLGVPFRIFWYRFGVFEAYYHMGRYDEVVYWAQLALENMTGMGAEEVYYWLGMGYAARRQFDFAITQMETAIKFNPNFMPAVNALQQLRDGTYHPPLSS